MPLNPMGKDYTTYHSNIGIDLPVSLSEDPGLKNPGISLAGFKMTSRDKDADIRIDLNFRNFTRISEKMMKDQVYNINKGENETGYYYLLFYDYPAEMIVSTADNKVLLHREIKPDSSDRIVKFGKWTYSEDELNNKFNDEREKIETGVQKSCAYSVMNRARDMVNSLYGYPVKTERMKIAEVKSKKGPFHIELKQAAVYMEEALTKDKKYKLNPESENLMDKAMGIWKQVLAEYAPGSKSKVSYNLKLLLLYNSAQGALWLNRFDEARSYAEKANQMLTKNTSGKVVKMIRTLQKQIVDREQRYQVNQ